MGDDDASRLTHLDDAGRARMVDVSGKPATARIAVASARVLMSSDTLAALQSNGLPKGDALAVARVAGILAAKETPRLIPLCHQIPLGSVTVEFAADESAGALIITATASTVAQTGAEMEALTAAIVAALTIYDMAKALDRAMTITDIRLERKSGGKSGDFVRDA